MLLSAQSLMCRKSYINLMVCFLLSKNGRNKKTEKKEIVYVELHLKLKKRHLDLKSKQKKITGMEAISSDAKILF